MSNNRRSFTCYFCNQLIENETEVGHTSLCSKVLIPCPYKCGSYVPRASLPKHKMECTNNVRKSASFDMETSKTMTNNFASLGRNPLPSTTKPNGSLKIQDQVANLQTQIVELQRRLALANQNSTKNDSANSSNSDLTDLKNTVKQHSQTIQKTNYINGFLLEWKKKIDLQLTSLTNSTTTLDTIKQETTKHQIQIQEKLLQLQNLQMDLNRLKETLYKNDSRSKNVEADFARNLEEIRFTFNRQNESFEKMWLEQTDVIQNLLKEIQSVKNSIDEQKAKYAGLVFDFRAVSQISSETAEKVEILERDFNIVRQEVNQLKINMEILEDLSSDDNTKCQRLIWRITDVESKLKRAKENDIVLKSPIFYTHEYGYKIRVLLYINGLKKWKDRYALACLHVLKGEYDPLLEWPCLIEGYITLRDVVEKSQKKDFSKYIKTKKSSGDEDEDEPQESTSTYIFIPHSVLLKEKYLQDDTIFLDISINDKSKHETSL